MNIQHKPEKTAEKAKKAKQPPQVQDHQPGVESEMRPQPDYRPKYPGVGKLKDKVAIITGGDSGIGRAVAVAMAREGALIAILYLEETRRREGDRAPGRGRGKPRDPVRGRRRRRDVLLGVGRARRTRSSAASTSWSTTRPSSTRSTIRRSCRAEQLERTFRTNVFCYFHMTRACLQYMQSGASIINTTSITAYQGHKTLIDYAATKGAIVAMTRSLSQALIDKGIRVNGVAPGPIWTPLIPASFEAEKVARHGESVPMERAGQPNEVAPCYVFLASDDASYISGQVLHPNGGKIVNA